MEDVKCENVSKFVKSNAAIATNEFASNLTPNILLLLAI